MSNGLEGKTLSDFIKNQETQLKEYLEQNDLQINKLGVIGFFINLLGNTTFDVKQYYDKLFQESFLSTSREDYNILMHASKYGFNPSYASPSVASGNFIFDFTKMPRPASDVEKREVIFYDIKFNVDGYVFTSDTQYKFVREKDNYYCVVTNLEEGYSEYVSSSGPLIEAPFFSVKQVSKQRETLKIQNYEYGNFYPYEIELDDGYFSDIIVKVRDPEETGSYDDPEKWPQYKLVHRKHAGYSEKVAFLKRLGARRVLIEFGSGNIGTYVPNTNALIKLYKTQGSKGNVQVETETSFEKTTKVTATDYKINEDTGEETSVNSFSASSVLKMGKIEFFYSEGGEDLLVGEDLRDKALEYAQSRDNLLSEKDFYNIGKKHYDDFKFTFKKFQILENTFYLHKCFRDQYYFPIKSTSLTIPVIDKSTVPSLSGSVYSEDEGLKSGEWEFYIVATDGFNDTEKSDTVTLTVDDTDNAVNLSWDIVENANSYFIYGKHEDDDNYRRWKVIGSEEDNLKEDDGGGGTYILDVSNRESKISFNPVFAVNDKEFISPFVYKFNEFMNWYDGYILKDNLIININDIYSEDQKNIDLPVFFFNVWYHYGKSITSVDLKSTSDISEYDFYLSIEEEGINDESLDEIDENTYRYEFSDSDHGIFWDKISLKLEVFSSSGSFVIKLKTKQFYQIIDIKDQLKIINHTLDSSEKIIGIPVIDRDKYREDSEYYLDKIDNYLDDVSFSENRLITDNINFSFLNTYKISSKFLKHITTQKYDSFDIVLPLKLSVEMYVSRENIRKNNINIEDEREKIEEELIDLLQEKYTGTEITFYNTHIVDFIHDNDFVKYVKVKLKDSEDTTIDDGLEIREINDIINSINDDGSLSSVEKKETILEYTPPYFYWDFDNIEIEVIFE